MAQVNAQKPQEALQPAQATPTPETASTAFNRLLSARGKVLEAIQAYREAAGQFDEARRRESYLSEELAAIDALLSSQAREHLANLADAYWRF